MVERESPVPPENIAGSAAAAQNPPRRKSQNILALSVLALAGGCAAVQAGGMVWGFLHSGLVTLIETKVGERPFDSAEWKRLGDPSTLKGRVVRQVMARDLMEKRSLIGLSWDAASEMLGPPDPGMSFTHDGYGAHCYGIELPLGDGDYFVVWTDRAGIVDKADFRAVHDGVITSP